MGPISGCWKPLEKLKIVPDVVTGTSMGALVGAAFVTGKLAALRSRMENFSKADIAGMLDLRLATGGLIEGRRIENFLDSLKIQGSIETFSARYGAVARRTSHRRKSGCKPDPWGGRFAPPSACRAYSAPWGMTSMGGWSMAA